MSYSLIYNSVRLNLCRVRLVEIAQRRVQAKMPFQANDRKLTRINLEKTQRRIEETKGRIQEMINRAVALGWSCEENIDLVCSL